MLPRPRVKRFLLVTLGITGLYLGLNALWLALTPSLAALFDARDAVRLGARGRGRSRGVPRSRQPAAAGDARRRIPAGISRRLLQQSPRQRGAVAARGAGANARDPAPRIKATQDLGQALGVGEISFLTVSNADEFGRVPIGSTRTNWAWRRGSRQATSRRHRHLLLLGMHVGVAAAMTELTGGKIADPVRPRTSAATRRWPACRRQRGNRPPASPRRHARTAAAAYQAALTALDMAVAELGPVRLIVDRKRPDLRRV